MTLVTDLQAFHRPWAGSFTTLSRWNDLLTPVVKTKDAITPPVVEGGSRGG